MKSGNAKTKSTKGFVVLKVFSFGLLCDNLAFRSAERTLLVNRKGTKVSRHSPRAYCSSNNINSDHYRFIVTLVDENADLALFLDDSISRVNER